MFRQSVILLLVKEFGIERHRLGEIPLGDERVGEIAPCVACRSRIGKLIVQSLVHLHRARAIALLHSDTRPTGENLRGMRTGRIGREIRGPRGNRGIHRPSAAKIRTLPERRPLRPTGFRGSVRNVGECGQCIIQTVGLLVKVAETKQERVTPGERPG